MKLEYQRVAQDGLVETVGSCVGVFYSNDGMVGSHDLNWLQYEMNGLVGLFRRYVLAANVAKSRTMNFQPRALRAGMLEEAMSLKCTGVEESYQMRLRSQIPCPEYEVELTAGSMKAHRRCMHRNDPAINWSWLPVSQIVHQTQVYDTRFLRTTKQYLFPFVVCPGSSRTWIGLRFYFNKQN